MEITGRIKLIMDEQRFDSGFFKREFVITTDDQYPQVIKFELLKDKVEQITSFKPEDAVRVLFDIRGSEWNGKFFNNLVAWKIEALAETANAASPSAAAKPAAQTVDISAEEEDDLPF